MSDGRIARDKLLITHDRMWCLHLAICDMACGNSKEKEIKPGTGFTKPRDSAP